MSPHGGTRKGAGRPTLPEGEKKQIVSYTLTEKAIAKIKRMAATAGLSASAFLEERVKKFRE